MGLSPGREIEFIVRFVKESAMPGQSNTRQQADRALIGIFAKFLSCCPAAVGITQESPQNESVVTVLTLEIDGPFHVAEVGFRAMEQILELEAPTLTLAESQFALPVPSSKISSDRTTMVQS